MLPMLHASVWLLAILLSVVLTVLLQEPIHWLLARLLGGLLPRPARGIRGLWQGDYTYGKDNSKRESQLVELRQVGNYVLGKNLTGHAHWYKLRGRVEYGSILTGMWRSRKEGNIYHGAFQAFIDPRGETIKGRWIGFGRSNEINQGPWEFRLLSRRLNKAAKEKALKEAATSTEPVEVTGEKIG